MRVQDAAGIALALASCAPAWGALEHLSSGDYLSAGLALGLTWILARAGLELTGSSRGDRLSGRDDSL